MCVAFLAEPHFHCRNEMTCWSPIFSAPSSTNKTMQIMTQLIRKQDAADWSASGAAKAGGAKKSMISFLGTSAFISKPRLKQTTQKRAFDVVVFAGCGSRLSARSLVQNRWRLWAPRVPMPAPRPGQHRFKPARSAAACLQTACSSSTAAEGAHRSRPKLSKCNCELAICR